uniref:Pheromone Phb2.2 B44 n=1 Tax=Coprinopsis cinerea TaxID=5346 RepID=Q6TMC1_COPCI|nr:pheromone precursor Phb2.2 B44 [Coprinopsis cinerea]
MDSFTTLNAQTVFDELNLDIQDDSSRHLNAPDYEGDVTNVPTDQERPGDGRKTIGAFCVMA